jgi:hypothetical protein
MNEKAWIRISPLRTLATRQAVKLLMSLSVSKRGRLPTARFMT